MNSLQKGKTAERQLAEVLSTSLGERILRNLDQPRDGGCDLVIGRCWAIEVKRAKDNRNYSSWWSQTLGNAKLKGLLPVLAYRLDRKQWKFVFRVKDLFDGYKNMSDDMANDMTDDMVIESDLSVACMIMRMQL